MKFSLAFLKKKKFWIPAVIIVLGGVWMMYGRNANKGPFYDTQAVVRGDVVQTVEVTGSIKPDTRTDLAFKASGKLVSLKVSVGQKVKTGDLLAQLDTRDLGFGVARARASLLSAQANYNKAVAGAADTDIGVSQAAVDAAQVALDNAKRSLEQTRSQQDLLVKNALANLLNSGIVATPGTSNISANAPTISGTYTGTAQGRYNIRLYTGGGLHYVVSGLESSEGLVSTVAPNLLGAHGLSIQFPTGTLYESDTWTVEIPNTRSSTYLTNLNAYQAAQQTQSQALSTAQNAVNAAEAALEQAQAALTQKKAPARLVDLESLHAQVLEAQASYAQAVAQLEDAEIIAPADGTVSEIVPTLGEQVLAGTKAVSLVITGAVTVQVSLPEADVAKVQAGQSVSMTLDAFGDDVKFSGQVLKVDPDQTKIQDAVYYNADVTLNVASSTSSTSSVKPGMTANVTILTGQQTSTLFIPSRAVIIKNGQKMVRVLAGGQAIDTPVTLGLRGDDGKTEVTSGIKEGDQVIVGELTAQEYAQKKATK